MKQIEISSEQFPCPDCGTMISETQTECSICGRFFEALFESIEREQEKRGNL